VALPLSAFSLQNNSDRFSSTKDIHDTIRIQEILNHGINIQSQSMDSALYYYRWVVDLADKIAAEPSVTNKVSDALALQKAVSLCNIGRIHSDQGHFDLAIDHCLKSLQIFEKYASSPDLGKALAGKKGMSDCYNNYGVVHRNQGSYDKALEYYYMSFKIAEEIGNSPDPLIAKEGKNKMSRSYNNIGFSYSVQKNYAKAVEYFLKSIKIDEEIGDKRGLSSGFNNMGLVYKEIGKYDQALEYFHRSLKLKKEFNDKKGITLVYERIASLHIALADSTKGISPDAKAQHLEKALEFGHKAFDLAKEIGSLPSQNIASKTLMTAYKKLGDSDNALEFAEIFMATKDSMYSDEKTKTLAEMQAKYEDEKKMQEIEKQRLTIEKQEIDFLHQRTQRNFFVAGSFLLVLLVLVVFRGYRQKNNSNIIISEKNTMLEQAYEEIKTTLEALASKNEKLLEQHNEIEKQRNNLAELNAELQSINEEILAQKEELERTQKQLIQSEKMASIGVLTAGIAHEINNPINFVYAGVNSVIRDFSDLEQVLQIILNIENSTLDPKEAINEIIEKKKESDFAEAYKAIEQTMHDILLGAERTAEIVQGLRNFSRSEKDDFDLANINKVIEGVLLLLKNKYKNHIKIVKNLDPDLPNIVCKYGKMNQVIMNLVSNAIDAIKEDGVIEISTQISGPFCYISVKDNGGGISEEVLPNIFDPFFTTKDVGKGTGLGLSISYAIIEEHNGKIEVKSKQGEGTEFTIILPVKQ
jgi:signal transduction histidine kinase/tetratricopeptide (TPR) repeat protein